MLQITLNQFNSVIKNHAEAEYLVQKINEVIPKYKLDTRNRLVHWLAQISYESSGLIVTEENLNYSATRLLQVFPMYFNSSNVNEYARKPKKIANKVYANRLGNGDESSGDGYRYRGRGFIQLTGKYNYQKFSQLLGYDLVNDPDSALKTSYAIYIAAAFWSNYRIWRYADNEDIYSVTKAVNGGYNGIQDRCYWLTKWKSVIE